MAELTADGEAQVLAGSGEAVQHGYEVGPVFSQEGHVMDVSFTRRHW